MRDALHRKRVLYLTVNKTSKKYTPKQEYSPTNIHQLKQIVCCQILSLNINRKNPLGKLPTAFQQQLGTAFIIWPCKKKKKKTKI